MDCKKKPTLTGEDLNNFENTISYVSKIPRNLIFNHIFHLSIACIVSIMVLSNLSLHEYTIHIK